MAGLLVTTAVATAQTGPVFVMDEIVFSANADETEAARSGFSVEVIDGEDLSSAGDLQVTEYLQRLPGISLAQQGPQGTAADVRIRGARSRYVSVYVDGILVTDPSSTNVQYDDFGSLTTGGIRRIEILKGSQGALYGGTAVAGVINITTIGGEETPMGLTQRFEAEAGTYDTLSLGYGLTQRDENTILSFGISHARSDGFSAAEEKNGNTEADGFDRTRLSFGLTQEVSDALSVGVNGFVEDGRAEFDDFVFVPPANFAPGDGTTDDEQEREALGLRAWAIYDTGAWEHEFSLSGYSVERRSMSDGLSSVFEGRRLAFDYQATGQATENVALSLGLSAKDEVAEYANTPGGRSSVETYGAFAEAVWSPSDVFDLTGTVRYDDHSAFGGEATGRLGFAWRPGEGTVVRGAVSTGYRPPSLDELFGNYPGFFPFVGNPNLQPEESVSYELGVEHEYANGALVSATLFRLDIENLVTFRVGAPSTLVNLPGTSTRDGIELAGRLPLTDRLALTGAYTYTDARDATGVRLDRVPEHDLVLGLDAEVTDRLNASFSLQHVSGLNDAGTPLGDYEVLDLRLGYELRDGLEAWVRVKNLTDEQYQTVRGYGTSDRAVYAGFSAAF